MTSSSQNARSPSPLLHVYPQTGPGETVTIVGNTQGLQGLMDALVNALGHQANGSTQVLTNDGQFFTVEVWQETEPLAWEERALPYPVLPSPEPPEPEEPEVDEGVADFYNYYATESDERLHETQNNPQDSH